MLRTRFFWDQVKDEEVRATFKVWNDAWNWPECIQTLFGFQVKDVLAFYRDHLAFPYDSPWCLGGCGRAKAIMFPTHYSLRAFACCMSCYYRRFAELYDFCDISTKLSRCAADIHSALSEYADKVLTAKAKAEFADQARQIAGGTAAQFVALNLNDVKNRLLISWCVRACAYVQVLTFF
jgi:hypothetical protein